MKNYLINEETRARNHQPLSQFITTLRKSVHMSQRELAKQAGISNATIHRIETEDMIPDPETLYLISKVLHVDYNYLMQISGYVEYQPSIILLQRLFHRISNDDIEKLIKIAQIMYPEQYDDIGIMR